MAIPWSYQNLIKDFKTNVNDKVTNEVIGGSLHDCCGACIYAAAEHIIFKSVLQILGTTFKRQAFI